MKDNGAWGIELSKASFSFSSSLTSLSASVFSSTFVLPASSEDALSCLSSVAPVSPLGEVASPFVSSVEDSGETGLG